MDLKDLNRRSPLYEFPFPYIDNATKKDTYSIIDTIFGYNYTKITEDDKTKTTFTFP